MLLGFLVKSAGVPPVNLFLVTSTRCFRFLVAAVCGIVLSGCMTSPYHGEDIGKSTNPVNFHGYAHKPNQKVTIQARRTANDNWTTIAVTYSKTNVVYYNGSTMYPWWIKKVVPSTHWKYYAIGTENSGLHEHRSCFVRAVVDGSPLPTFAVADVETLLDPEIPGAELWEAYGFSDYVKIYADQKSSAPQPAP